MAKLQTTASYISKSKKRRKHSKQESKNKRSKNYSKPYKGQGR